TSPRSICRCWRWRSTASSAAGPSTPTRRASGSACRRAPAAKNTPTQTPVAASPAPRPSPPTRTIPMQMSDVLNNATDQDKGRLLELVDPFEGKPTGLKFWIVGPDSDTARRAQITLADELADMADADGRVTAEQREKARLNCLARHVQRWEVEEDG